MARYGNFVYGGNTYGSTPKLAFSVEPMSITVLDYDRTFVEWQTPKGDFTRIRLVRSQTGYPENEEDGVIVYEEFATEGNVSVTTFIDSEDAESPIVAIDSGRQIYYRMFLYVDEVEYWVVAGQVTDTVPFNHDSQKKLMDIIPKVYTSSVQSPLGVTDESSDLYKFIEGVSFTVDQLLTQIDILKPNHALEQTPASLLPIELLNVGFTTEQNLPVKYQKRLGREAFYMYTHKGLTTGLETYVEAVTGYAPDISVSPNRMLTIQDSTFLETVGNWTTSNVTLSSVTEQVPDITDYVIDEAYTGKCITSNSNAFINLGASDPIRLGVPVSEDTDYTFGYKYKSPASAGTVTLTVKFFDKDGVDLAEDFVGASNSANNTWQTSWENTTTPEDAVYASLKLTFSATGTYYVDQIYVEEGENLDDTSFQEARAITIFLNPNKSNYITNPSFEEGTTNWTITATADSVELDAPDSVGAGEDCLELELDTGAIVETETAVIPITNAYYTLSFYAKASDELDVTVTLTPNDDGTPTEGEEIETFTLSTDWERYIITAFIDEDDVTENLTYTINLDFDTAAGETASIDAFQLEKSFRATDYFDGSLSSQFGAVWEGTEHESVSHSYTNKAIKLPRLSQTLDQFVPANAYWRLTSYAGVEYTRLSV